jgi:hypothetical protein
MRSVPENGTWVKMTCADVPHPPQAVRGLTSRSVIVRDLYIPRRSLAPFKAYPPSIVGVNAVLSTPVDLATG